MDLLKYVILFTHVREGKLHFFELFISDIVSLTLVRLSFSIDGVQTPTCLIDLLVS